MSTLEVASRNAASREINNQTLLPMLQPKQDHPRAVGHARAFAIARSPMRPQAAIAALSEALAPDAVILLDCGANTHFAAHTLKLKEGQRLTGTGLLATMTPGLPYAIAMAFA